MAEETANEIYSDIQERAPLLMWRVRYMLACDNTGASVVAQLCRLSQVKQIGVARFRTAVYYLVQRIVDGEESCDN